jgi:hypothetical protein
MKWHTRWLPKKEAQAIKKLKLQMHRRLESLVKLEVT